jgi:DNA ligase D-like protein (predicted ligase)/DNA ligase D-like protein (predicted 3'-phosphoesterase)
MGLQQYWRKRNFKETPEPRGASQSPSERLQFVIQQHAASRLHYDFRLELAGTLKSWAIPKGPCLDPSHKRLAVHVEDHPLDYGGFEGIIPPKQYGAGTVLLWDRGSWSPVGDPMASYRRGRLKFSLKGHKLRGLWNLVRMGGRHEEGKDNWLLIKEKDDEARTGEQAEVTQFLTTSVATMRTLEQIASGRHRVWQSNPLGEKEAKSIRRPHKTGMKKTVGARRTPQEDWIRPQLATLADEVPVGEEWVHELKYDGYRILCRVKNGSAKLVTRNDHDWTAKLQRIAEAAAALPIKNAWLDGEVVALMPDGTISFQGLQNAFETRSETNLVYYVFDLLYLDGYDLRQVTLLDRKRSLAAMMPSDASALIRYSDHIQGQGDVVFSEACRKGMEGLISKRSGAVYLAGRNRNWIKVKCGRRQEFVIGGFTDPSGSRVAFGGLRGAGTISICRKNGNRIFRTLAQGVAQAPGCAGAVQLPICESSTRRRCTWGSLGEATIGCRGIVCRMDERRPLTAGSLSGITQRQSRQVGHQGREGETRSCASRYECCREDFASSPCGRGRKTDEEARGNRRGTSHRRASDGESSRSNPISRARFHQTRVGTILRTRESMALASPARSALDAGALPGGIQQRLFLSKTCHRHGP